jgi:transposase-like protein
MKEKRKQEMANKITITPEIKAEILKQYYDTDVEVKALAAKHGISRQAIYNWAKGMRRKSTPKSIRIITLNKALWAARNHNALEERVNNILRKANVSPNAFLCPSPSVMLVTAWRSSTSSSVIPLSVANLSFEK